MTIIHILRYTNDILKIKYKKKIIKQIVGKNVETFKEKNEGLAWSRNKLK